ncbi:MAG: EAL domain-containing protein [Betaproteobacteria bacterium]|nr:EAL domain-containing protein [Betaproteobacteria bacterium]
MDSAQEIERRELRDRLNEEIARAQEAHQRLAVIILTLSRTDRLDEIFGRGAGEILSALRRVLPSALRAADRIACLSEQQVCLILPGLKSNAQSVLAAAKIASVCAEATIDGAALRIRPVIGIACYPDHGQSADQLVVSADIAERIARSRDLSQYLFEPSDRGEVHAYLGLETALREALATNQLEVHYQPQVHLMHGGCVGVEALLRWTVPTRGAIPPPIVIRMAEECGLIGALTAWIANTVIRHQSEWRQQGILAPVSINLSTVNLVDHDLPEVFAQMVGTWGADPSAITLEITESASISNADKSYAVLKRLKDLGLKLSVDDFGTGYSSLSYVRRFPLDELKIDKLFVQHMRQSRADQAIVRSVIDLAHNFDLQVVAEGVENEATRDELCAMGCDVAQGYFIGTPMPARELPVWLARLAALETGT